MVKNKKIDEKDLGFVNQPWTTEEKESFSKFLKSRKKQKLRRKERKNILPDNGSSV